MAKYEYLGLDGKERFTTHAEILNNVFDYKVKNGAPIKLALDSVYKIAPNKRAWFPHLAQPNSGGWKAPENIGWINIPSPDQRFITQIPLKNNKTHNETPEEEKNSLAAHYAVFVCEGTKPSDKYRFYGIYSHGENDKNGIKIWKRLNTVLVCSAWKAQRPDGIK
jgi:hypothetical protein